MSIRVENLSHTYNPGTPFERCAVDNVTLEIKDGGIRSDYRRDRFGKIDFDSTLQRLAETHGWPGLC